MHIRKILILSIGPNSSFTDTYTKSVITTIEPRPFGAEAEFENRLRQQQGTQIHHHQMSGQSPHNTPHHHAATSAIEKLLKAEVLNGGGNGGIRNGGNIVVVSCGDQVRMQSVITSCQSVQKPHSGGKVVVGDSRTAVNGGSGVENADTILPTLHSSIESYLSSQETLTSTESSFNSSGNLFHHLLDLHFLFGRFFFFCI